MRRSADPLSAGFSRATRRSGLTIRSGRSAHETTLAGCEGRPGARHLYGEVVCEAIERLQRSALNAPRPELVVKVDRSGLNEHHAVVKRLYAAIDQVLKPIVAEEERRAGAHLIGTARAVTARDQVGLRALNDALKAAFDHPGATGRDPGTANADHAPDSNRDAIEDVDELEQPAPGTDGPDQPDCEITTAPGPAIYFKQSPIRLHPGEADGHDPRRSRPAPRRHPDHHRHRHGADNHPAPRRDPRTWRPRPMRDLRRAAGKGDGEPGARLTVIAAAGEATCELEVIIVRHRASGWVREIARKDEDQLIEADFDPETGIVTVYEGRKEFRELERAARRAGHTKKRVAEYVPYRMLEVEAAANAVYTWAAAQILAGRLPKNAPPTPPNTPPPCITNNNDCATRAPQTDAGVPRTRNLRRRRHPPARHPEPLRTSTTTRRQRLDAPKTPTPHRSHPA